MQNHRTDHGRGTPRRAQEAEELGDFSSLFPRMSRVGFSAAMSVLWDRAEAEDVAADTLLKVVRYWDVMTTWDSLRRERWISLVAANRARDIARRGRRRASLRVPIPQPPVTPDDSAVALDLLRSIGRLPARQQRMVRLASWGYAASDLARSGLCSSPRAATCELYRIRRALRLSSAGGPSR